MKKILITILSIIMLSCSQQTSQTTAASTAEHSTVASPDVYKIIAENDVLRVIMATWEPGQKDNLHSHPTFAVYAITDVNGQLERPDGSISEVVGPAGTIMVRDADLAHTFQNLSDVPCQILIVEHK
jgi:hypothetical protein